MNKPMTLPRLVCLTASLAAASMLMTMDIANARQNHQHATGHIQQRPSHPAIYAKRYGFSPRFAINGQPANVKGVLNQRKESREAQCRTRCFQPMQTATIATKGNLTQSTAAGNTASTVNLHGLPNATAHATDKRVVKALSAAATVSIVPAAAGVGTAVIGHPGMGIVGTIQHGNPITGPAQESIDFAKEYTSDVESVIKRLW
jgi:hypothetical protein